MNKLLKKYQKFIIGTFLVILLIPLYFFINNYFKKTFECNNLNLISDEIYKNFPESKSIFTNSKEYGQLKIKIDEEKPIQIYQPSLASVIAIPEEKITEATSIFKSKIESKIFDLGFNKEYSYRRGIDSWETSQYKLGDIYLTIEVPIITQTDSSNTNFNVSCGKINKNEQLAIEKISVLYNKSNSIQIWENSSNVITANIYDENYGGGSAFSYDVSNLKPEIIYKGSERINCDILKSRNIGKGIKCYDNTKKDYVIY